jgi:hypothetical protein
MAMTPQGKAQQVTVTHKHNFICSRLSFLLNGSRIGFRTDCSIRFSHRLDLLDDCLLT